MSTRMFKFLWRIWKIIPKLSPNSNLICSTAYIKIMIFDKKLDCKKDKNMIMPIIQNWKKKYLNHKI